MGKTILILTGSARRNGNSGLLADAFAEGAAGAGHAVERFDAARHRIDGCVACNTCWSKGVPCSFEDDFNGLLYPLLMRADAVVFAFPLYFCTFPAKLKAAVDKLYAFGGAERRKKPFPVREGAMLACAANEDVALFDGVLHNYRHILGFMGWEDRGTVIVPGVREPGAVAGADCLAEAERLGRSF